jgi:hypothetical protein
MAVYELPQSLFAEVCDLIGRLPAATAWHVYGALLQLRPREEGQEAAPAPIVAPGAAGEAQEASS